MKLQIERFFVAEMITHNFIFKGVGHNKEDARTALLKAWTSHRTGLLAQYPERTDSIPDATRMEDHFKLIIWNSTWTQAIAAMIGWCEPAPEMTILRG